MKRTLAVLIICGLALSGCGKTEPDGAELQAGKTESASAASTVTTAPVSTASSVKTTAVKTTSKTSAKTTVKTTSESTAKSTEKKSGTKKSSKKTDVTTQAPRYGNEQDNNGNYQAGGNNGGQTQPQSQNTTASQKTEKPSQTQKKTTTAKKTEKPKPKPTEAPEPQGLSQADISEINGYIKQAAKSYGMAGTNILSGYVDVWSEYSFNPPINTAINDTVPLIKNYVDSELGRIYREWSNDGVSDEEISQYLYINVYWEKDGDKYWIYLMW
ncbi:hypothetical protein [Ruminococcus sp. Marseille-P6503]|uniref:hypothetical protein n=1 Tax=Ruminococcus sp. Marseille-P6503 TaxID=2364796 RepID=UPI000F548F23|nr:hypothetical protein [Ruminococcus sp. Marseille-P6503]